MQTPAMLASLERSCVKKLDEAAEELEWRTELFSTKAGTSAGARATPTSAPSGRSKAAKVTAAVNARALDHARAIAKPRDRP